MSSSPSSETNARPLRSIEAAAIAGLLHAFLMLAARALLVSSPDPADGAAAAAWLEDGRNQNLHVVALNLLVIGGIMFVWFVAVIRRRVGENENRFFGTVFLGSALLLTSTWFSAGVLLTTPAVAAQSLGILLGPESIAALQTAGLTMSAIVAARLEAVFIISATTVAWLSGAFPRWLIVGGYVVGVGLLLAVLPNRFLTFVFPLWVAVMSVNLLMHRDDSSLTTPPAA